MIEESDHYLLASLFGNDIGIFELTLSLPMYLRQLKLWNFRKYGTTDGALPAENNPGLTVKFKKGLNILIGENNSGKTTIIDAVRFVLSTQSFDFQRLEDRDFFGTGDNRVYELRIECIFRGFTYQEAAGFLEWLGLDEENAHFLKVNLVARRRDNRVIMDIKAGPDDEGVSLDGAAKDLLRVTYLKPLRDADAELSPGSRSRLTQILRSDPTFKKIKNAAGVFDKHPLEVYLSKANTSIKAFFDSDVLEEQEDIPANKQGGKHIQDKIKKHLKSFFEKGAAASPFFEISGNDLLDILHRLGLNLESNKTGLGVLNQLYIATELILLQREAHNGLRLCLIEEIEAHLHPQAQLRMIDFLRNKEYQDDQFILSTHSTTLASKIDLDNLILCYNDKIFPIHRGYTALENDDYKFLSRFLDATKSNLFFAKGVILVEGDAENILLPVLAQLLDRNLHEYGVSIVNVGGRALLRYAKILMKADRTSGPLRVAVVTDLDIAKYREKDGAIKSKKSKRTNKVPDPVDERNKLEVAFNTVDGKVKVFTSPDWTFEYDMAKGGLMDNLYNAIRLAEFNQNRTKNGNFNGLSQRDVFKTLRKSYRDLERLKGFYQNDTEKLAYEIYSRLDQKKASKAVAAQYLAELLTLQKKSKANKAIVKTDTHLDYLRQAIYHVTAAENDGNQA